MSSNEVQIDHIVILLPYDVLFKNQPKWLTENFTVSPGGQHTDGKSQNLLIFFRDGSYLELFAFINDDAEKRKGHWWDKPYGVVDYSITTPAPSRDSDDVGDQQGHWWDRPRHDSNAYPRLATPDYRGLCQRLREPWTGVSYQKPQEGGRQLADGREVKWLVTFPAGVPRGAMPFFCHDVTARGWRVPFNDQNTTHPCGAMGIGDLIIEVPSTEVRTLRTAMTAILDLPDERGGSPFQLHTVQRGPGSRKPSVILRSRGPNITAYPSITLTLQTRDSARAEARDIEQAYGDGAVRICFVSASGHPDTNLVAAIT